MQPDPLARDIAHIAEHRAITVDRDRKPGLLEELADYGLLGMLAMIHTSARQRPLPREVGASAGPSQQDAAIPHRDPVGRHSLPIDEC